MTSQESILPSLASLKPELRERFGIASIALFGSAARGDLTPGSDVDVLVTFFPDAKVTLFTLAAITTRLQAALGRRVDVVEDHPRLRPSFRLAIAKDLRHVA